MNAFNTQIITRSLIIITYLILVLEFFENELIILSLSLIILSADIILRKKVFKFFNKYNYGLVFYVTAVVLLYFLLKNNYKWIFIYAISVITLSNLIASIVESYFAKKYFIIASQKKTQSGSLSFFLSTFLLMLIFGFIFLENPEVFHVNKSILNEQNIFLSAFIISIITTLNKLILSKGIDYFSGLFITAVLLYTFFITENNWLIQNFLIGVILACLVATMSYKIGFLTLSGSVATFLLASFIFGFGHLKWSVPILTFFVLSSLLSKIRNKRDKTVNIYFEKSDVRDHLQVLANGLIGGILVILYVILENEILYLVYISSLSAVCADTWATETGTLTKIKTYNILNLKPTEQGTSGGVSIIGILGGISGSIIIALTGIYWVDIIPFVFLSLIIFSGLVGNLTDSILGATLQIQYECPVCNKITEKKLHCSSTTRYFKGISWINNDTVNFLAGISGSITFLILYSLY
ncbi:DUF92 domain-containing protein [Bacteroidota bacterium]